MKNSEKENILHAAKAQVSDCWNMYLANILFNCNAFIHLQLASTTQRQLRASEQQTPQRHSKGTLDMEQPSASDLATTDRVCINILFGSHCPGNKLIPY